MPSSLEALHQAAAHHGPSDRLAPDRAAARRAIDAPIGAGRKRRLRRLAALSPALLALALLAACGKKGAPSAPGPANEMIFPHSYPSR